jgi:uridine kinase
LDFYLKKMSEENSYMNFNTDSYQRNFSKPYLIGISGGSASGKTTVAQRIFKELSSTDLKDCVLISMDSYYKPLS